MTVEQRLERLERQNRWLKRIATVCVAVVAVVFLLGQGKDKPRVVEAEAFVLRDSEGKQRAVLSMEKPNTPSLVLLDRDGTKRVYLLAEQGGRVGKAGRGRRGRILRWTKRHPYSEHRQ